MPVLCHALCYFRNVECCDFVTAISHRWHRQDILSVFMSCRCLRYELNWRQVKTENFETVLSILEMRCELSLVLSWSSFQFAMWLPIVMSCLETGSSKTSSQMHSHCRQDWTKPFCPQYINILNILTLTRQDNTVLSCQCRRCELAINVCIMTFGSSLCTLGGKPGCGQLD